MSEYDLIHKNVKISGKRTSIRIEPEMWSALVNIAKIEKCTVHELVSMIARLKRENSSLTSALRVFAMAYYREAATEEGHQKSGHGSYFFEIGSDIYLRKRQQSEDFNLHSKEEIR